MDSATLTINERFKTGSGILANLGTALFATAFGRWFVLGFDAYVFLWLAASGILVWTAIFMLTGLRAEALNG